MFTLFFLLISLFAHFLPRLINSHLQGLQAGCVSRLQAQTPPVLCVLQMAQCLAR